MTGKQMAKDLSRVVIAFLACFAAVVALTASRAYADTIECGNGWELEYSVSSGSATIDGASKVGSGKLVIPDSAGGGQVSAIAARAFYSVAADNPYAALTDVQIPSSVTTIGRAAFMNSGLTAVTLPAKLAGIPANCFANCSKLSSVTFAGDTLGYIEESAFARCTSLTEIAIPELTSYAPGSTYRMKDKVFSNCTKLQTVVFKGDANTDVSRYILYANAFEGCDRLANFVYYCKRFNIRRTTGSDDAATTYTSDPRINEGMKLYQTMRFFSSASDTADPSKAVYSVTCLDTVSIKDVLAGKVDSSSIWPGSETGSKSRIRLSSGVWGLEGAKLQSDSDKLEDTYNAVPVTKDDLAYGWVSSATVDEFLATHTGTNAFSRDYPTYYLDDRGDVVGLDDFVVYGADGSVVDPSQYELAYEEKDASQRDEVWDEVSYPRETGTFRVHAVGKAGTASAGTRTEPTEFAVAVFSPSVYSYADSNASRRWGRSANSAAVAMKGKARSVVIAPEYDWRQQLIGASLAGAAQGVMLVDDGKNVSSEAINAYLQAGVSAVEIVGSTAQVPQSASVSSEVYLADYLLNRKPTYQSRYSDDSSMNALADQAYTSVKALAEKTDNRRQAYGSWGTTAVVASAERSLDTLPLAQYVYTQKAPVFFVQPNGNLSSADLGYLASGDFTKIVIAGDASYVSAACASRIASRCGITPTRLFDSGGDALDVAFSSIDKLDGTTATVVVASAANTADLVSGAILAGARGGVMLPCGSTSDIKRIQDKLRSIIAEKGQASIRNVYVVGDFSLIDTTVADRMADMWSNPWPTTVGVGDSWQVGDYVYKFEAGNKASYVMLRDHGVANAVVAGTVSYGGATYALATPRANLLANASALKTVEYRVPIATVPEGLFANRTLLTSAKLGSGVKSIGASAFAGCTALTSVAAANAASIGASAFSGCAKLTTAPLAKLTAVPANAFEKCTALKKAALPNVGKVGASAFAGCTALASVTLPKATAIGESAFSGCKALKAVTGAKVASIGDSAFSGCAKMTSAAFTSASLAKIGAKAFSGCKKLATLKMKTKKLTAAKVGAGAFTGMPSSAKVYVPKAKVNSYKGVFVKKGLSKKAKVTAI